VDALSDSTALYARVSKEQDQTVETQFDELRRWAKESGARQVSEFRDELSSRDRRPQKEEVLRLARLGLISRIVVVRLDRWGRSLDELVPELEELSRRGVEFVSLREGLRFDSAAGRLHAHMLAAFAEFERGVIRERTLAGLSHARSEGRIGGRHPVGCGCGATPEGKPRHDGDVLPVREGKVVVAWRWPDGRTEPRKSNPPRPEGGPAPSRGAESAQTPV
jgi:putative DNA-invertase from lambdoid prophage Rac